ncbi:hypothetical protein CAter10_1653 [Collimonas arenae]|nr:hypothetical protein CAter10_1653 [Collimonas arenae]
MNAIIADAIAGEAAEPSAGVAVEVEEAAIAFPIPILILLLFLPPPVPGGAPAPLKKIPASPRSLVLSCIATRTAKPA